MALLYSKCQILIKCSRPTDILDLLFWKIATADNNCSIIYFKYIYLVTVTS